MNNEKYRLSREELEHLLATREEEIEELKSKKKNYVYLDERALKVSHKDYLIYKTDWLLKNLDREYEILKRLKESLENE